MVERLKHEGTSDSSSYLLKIFVKMGASWSAQDFRQTGVTQSGPGAFFLFCFWKTWRTSSSLIWIARVGERGVAWRGVQGGCGVFFQTCSRTRSDQLLILHSAGGWCPVVGDLFQTFPHWYTGIYWSHWNRIESLFFQNKKYLCYLMNSAKCNNEVYGSFLLQSQRPLHTWYSL